MKIYPLKYQRNEYAKRIRKDYEAGRIKERRCNMREITIDRSEILHTITGVLKDYAYMVEINEDMD